MDFPDVSVKEELDISPSVIQPRTNELALVKVEQDYNSDSTEPISGNIIFEEDLDIKDECGIFKNELFEAECSPVCSAEECFRAETKETKESSEWEVSEEWSRTGEQGSAHPSSSRDRDSQICTESITIASATDHTDAEIFPCGVCNDKFTSLENLKTHKKLHTTAKTTFDCVVCNAKFSYLLHLLKHKRKHERPFICKICNAQFAHFNDLHLHEQLCLLNYKQKHGQPFKGDLGNTKSTTQSLEEYRIIHTDGKQFHCKLCNATFTCSQTLKWHKRIHTDNKRFQCVICNAKYTDLQNLKKHKRTHIDSEPLQCDICYSNFAHLPGLLKHKQTHEPLFKCELCDAKFKYSQSLEWHKRIHRED